MVDCTSNYENESAEMALATTPIVNQTTPALTHLVPRRTTAAGVRRLLTRVPALLGRTTVALLTRRWARRGLVLLLARRTLAVALLRRWATVLTGGRRTAVAAGSGAALLASLLVLGVVAGVDGAENEFEDPEIGGELDWGLGEDDDFSTQNGRSLLLYIMSV